MLVRELMAKLVKHMDKKIVFSADEEGNGYMAKCDVDIYNKKTVIIFPYNYIDLDKI